MWNEFCYYDSSSPTPTPSQDSQGMIFDVNNLYDRQYQSGDNSQIDVELFGEDITELRQNQIILRDKNDRDLLEQVMTEVPVEQGSIAEHITDLLDGTSLFDERKFYSRSDDLNLKDSQYDLIWPIILIIGTFIGVVGAIYLRKYKKGKSL